MNPSRRAHGPAPRARLTEVGFRNVGGVSRVFLRTSVTPRFVIQDVGQDVVRVVLENTRALRRNDLRLLDTSFFSSAVVRITPARRGSSYVLDIRLRQRVPYQQRLEGDVLALDFERPASPGPGASPAARGARQVPTATAASGEQAR